MRVRGVGDNATVDGRVPLAPLSVDGDGEVVAIYVVRSAVWLSRGGREEVNVDVGVLVERA